MNTNRTILSRAIIRGLAKHGDSNSLLCEVIELAMD